MKEYKWDVEYPYIISMYMANIKKERKKERERESSKYEGNFLQDALNWTS